MGEAHVTYGTGPWAASGDAVVVDIGGSSVRMALTGRPDDVRELVVFDRAALDNDLTPVFDQLRDWAVRSLNRVVVAVPGVVDYTTSTLRFSHAVPRQWRQPLSAPAMAALAGAPAWLVNDVDLAAIAVAGRRTAGRHETVLYLNLGTGVGAAVVDGQVLVRGRHSLELADLHLAASPSAAPAASLMRLASANGVRRVCPQQRADVSDGVHRGCTSGACSTVLDQLAVGVDTLCRLFGVDAVVVGGARGRLPDVVDGLRRRLSHDGEVAVVDVAEPALLGGWYVDTALAPRPVPPAAPVSRTPKSPRDGGRQQ